MQITEKLQTISFDNALIKNWNWNLHLSEILTIDYKIDVAYFILCVEICAHSLKDTMTRVWKLPELKFTHL